MELAFLFFYFEEAVDRYSATGKPICLVGDVNINILLAQTCNYAQQFLDCLRSYALLPTIDKPTRVCNNSATLIDNIFTNKFSEYFASGNIVSDVTDHFSQFYIFQSSILTSQPAKITSRDYSKSSEQRFLQDLSQLHWESLLSGSDVDKLFSTFYNKLNKLINKHAPLRSLSKRKIKRLSKPWITKGIRKSTRIKARANARNIVGQQDATMFGPTCCERLHACCVLLRLLGSCWMKFETGQTSSNNFQQVATTHNMVCKRSQHIGPNNVASCWPTMLRAFARALRMSFSFLAIEISINFTEIKSCTFLELVKERFITIILRKMYAI